MLYKLTVQTLTVECLPVVADPVQPAERGGGGKPEEEADLPAAARHRLLLRTYKPRKHCRRSAAAGVHPNCPRPDQD